MATTDSEGIQSTILFQPPVDRPVPVSLNILDDVASLAYLMSAGRETVEYLIKSRSTTETTGLSFVRSFNGDIFPVVAAAALTRAWLPTLTSSSSTKRSSGTTSSSSSSSSSSNNKSVQEINQALNEHYHTTVFHDMDNARKQRRTNCAREGCVHSYSYAMKSKKKGTGTTNSSSETTDGTSSSSLLLCSRCKRVSYCSRTCQETAWKEGGHKRDCKGFQGLEESENAFRAGVSVCRAHHYELSATLIHYFLTRGPGILVINCENWLAFQSLYSTKGVPHHTDNNNDHGSSVPPTVMWPHGNRPASRILRITFLPLSDINPQTRKFHRPFLDILDSRQPGNLYAEAHDMATQLATRGLILFSDDAGHIFTLKIPLLPDAMVVQAILGLETVADSVNQQPITIHPEDIHAYSQTDLYIIDLDRPSSCNYAYPPFLFADTPFASPLATRISYDFHTWRMMMKATNLRLQKQQFSSSLKQLGTTGGESKDKYNDEDDDTMVPVQNVSAPELIHFVQEALQTPLPEEKIENEENRDSLWLHDDYRIARRMGLPYSTLVQTYLREQQEQITKLKEENLPSVTALTINDTITAQLKKDGLMNDTKSTTATTASTTLDPTTIENILAEEKFKQEKQQYRARLEEAKQAALKQLIDESNVVSAAQPVPHNAKDETTTEVSDSRAHLLGILEILPSGFDHKQGKFIGEDTAQARLRQSRSGGEAAFRTTATTTKENTTTTSPINSSTPVTPTNVMNPTTTKAKAEEIEMEINTVGTNNATNETINDTVPSSYNPSAYQLCICPGWSSVARERLRLYRYGMEQTTVPLTYQVYGTMEI